MYLCIYDLCYTLLKFFICAVSVIFLIFDYGNFRFVRARRGDARINMESDFMNSIDKSDYERNRNANGRSNFIVNFGSRVS